MIIFTGSLDNAFNSLQNSSWADRVDIARPSMGNPCVQITTVAFWSWATRAGNTFEISLPIS
jgi:hypothetical protein